MSEATASLPAITREQETRLYTFLRANCEDDAFRYEMIAKKIHRTADGTGNAWDVEIATIWLQAMLKHEAAVQSVA